jgi:hypothetical protein
MTHNTGVKCPHCDDAPIVAEVESVSDTPIGLMPIGPGSAQCFTWEVTSFHCERCQTLFRVPPGRPDAANEILADLRRKQQAVADEATATRIREVLGKEE